MEVPGFGCRVPFFWCRVWTALIMSVLCAMLRVVSSGSTTFSGSAPPTIPPISLPGLATPAVENAAVPASFGFRVS